ncbi:hypothetical protein PybrP1_011171 [[Pythium] brassicae (nom. inval.)]|nr:hypothetical protein PybrP1_011171 [[Pythium] brassicae (nom. inval.)]
MNVYSTDTPVSQSEHSQHWELQFSTIDCAAWLEGVRRAFWVTHSIFVHHVSAYRQPPYLICGTSGHLARACNVPAVDT